MKTSEVEILIIPGWSNSGDDHWQTRWQRSLKTARRVEQTNWLHPDLERWTGTLVSTIAKSPGDVPVVLVAHSLGVALVAHAAHHLPREAVAGAFLVAPADVDNAHTWPQTNGYFFDRPDHGFAPMRMERLPFPAAVVASTNDPYCRLERARQMALCWGASLIEAGEAGHINTASGHGPWPEGLMRFGWFLKQISDPGWKIPDPD
jgi:hypothetical protein